MYRIERILDMKFNQIGKAQVITIYHQVKGNHNKIIAQAAMLCGAGCVNS